jgi:hypothetical protein
MYPPPPYHTRRFGIVASPDFRGPMGRLRALDLSVSRRANPSPPWNWNIHTHAASRIIQILAFETGLGRGSGPSAGSAGCQLCRDRVQRADLSSYFAEEQVILTDAKPSPAGYLCRCREMEVCPSAAAGRRALVSAYSRVLPHFHMRGTRQTPPVLCPQNTNSLLLTRFISSLLSLPFCTHGIAPARPAGRRWSARHAA